MNYYPLFRVRSWNNGVRCMSFYILMAANWNHAGIFDWHHIWPKWKVIREQLAHETGFIRRMIVSCQNVMYSIAVLGCVVALCPKVVFFWQAGWTQLATIFFFVASDQWCHRTLGNLWHSSEGFKMGIYCTGFAPDTFYIGQEGYFVKISYNWLKLIHAHIPEMGHQKQQIKPVTSVLWFHNKSYWTHLMKIQTNNFENNEWLMAQVSLLKPLLEPMPTQVPCGAIRPQLTHCPLVNL